MDDTETGQQTPALNEAAQAALEALKSEYPPLLTTAEVAELMGSSIYDIRVRARNGDIPAVKWGQQYRFLRDEILALLGSSHN